MSGEASGGNAGLEIGMAIAQRCRDEGVAAAVDRRATPDTCPYGADQELERAAWLDGWSIATQRIARGETVPVAAKPALPPTGLREPRWRLQVSLIGPYGEAYHVAEEIDTGTMGEIAYIEPLSAMFMASMEEAVTVLRRKQFRERLFVSECTRMGHVLAQRLADKEGWYGMDRADALKHFGRPWVVVK